MEAAPIKRGDQILLRQRETSGTWRIYKARVTRGANKHAVAIPTTCGVTSREREGTDWVRGWEGTTAAAFIIKTETDNKEDSKRRVAEENARLEQERVAREEAVQERRQRVVERIAEAVHIVDEAKVPAELREAAFKFALMTSSASPYTFVWR